jgi:hypothetical protein
MTITETSASGRFTVSDMRASSMYRIAPAVVASVVSLVLAWAVLGFAGALVLVSAWLLAAGIGRLLPSLRGPASWAAGIVAEFALIVGLSAAVALVSPHGHGQALHLVIIALTAVLGAALLLVARWRGPDRVEGWMPSRWGVALSINAGVLAVAGWIASRGPLNGIAWAMSGDARNHVTIIRHLLANGGVTLGFLKTYPAAVNGVASVIAGAGDRGQSAGRLIINDAHAMATTYVLCAIAIAVLLAGALIEILPRAVRCGRRLPGPVVATLFIAAASAGSPFVLGIALADGFFSAYGALVAALAGVVLALRFHRAPRAGFACLIPMMVATLLTFASWTVLVVVPAALLLAMALLAIRTVVTSRREVGLETSRASLVLQWINIAGALGTLGAVFAVIVRFMPALKATFAFPGSSRTAYAFMIPVLCLVAVAVALAVRSKSLRRQMLVPVVAAVAGAVAILWLFRLPGSANTWTYYSTKTNWLVSSSLVWVAFAPIVLWFARDRGSTTSRVRERLSRAGAAVAGALAVSLLFGSATSAPEPVLAAARGWSQPSAEVLGEMVRDADKGQPYVLWGWSDVGNDKLGNFWSVLAWASTPAGDYTGLRGQQGSFALWAYFMDGKISGLCELVDGSPGITVYTHSTGLSSELQAACPAAQADVVVED